MAIKKTTNMKKIFILLFLLTALSLQGFAQSGIYSGGVSTVVKRDLRKTGWIVRPEVGGAMFGTFDFFGATGGVGIGVNVGYQYSPRVYFGGGINCLVRLDERTYDVYSGIYGYDNFETLYASARWYWFDGRSSPFFELNLGVGRFMFHESGWYHWYFGENNSKKGALFVIPTLGFDIRNVDFKIGAYFTTNKLSFAPYVMIGYNYLIKNLKTTEK